MARWPRQCRVAAGRCSFQRAPMRIDLHDEAGQHLRWMHVDPEQPPRVIRYHAEGGKEAEHYLEWDGAFDDEGHLRRCPGCGCDRLYKRRACPPVTGFVIVLLVGLACLALYGVSHAPLGLLAGALGVVIVANVLIIYFSPRYLGCYRCGSQYHGAAISRSVEEWDANVAERYRPGSAEPSEDGDGQEDRAEAERPEELR